MNKKAKIKRLIDSLIDYFTSPVKYDKYMQSQGLKSKEEE